MRLRTRAYTAGWPRRRRLPLPAVGIGSLEVGGAGKTPVASWAAGWFLERGVRSAILLRGYGGDEGPLHRTLQPGAVVVEDPDRYRGALRAVADGAAVAVLDDSAQHLRVVPDRQILLFNADTLLRTRALLPAGPWRERWDTGTGHVLLVTRKSATRAEADGIRAMLRTAYPDLPAAQAHLSIAGWTPLAGRPAVSVEAGGGLSLYAVCGVADPGPFLEAVRQLGRLRGGRILRDHARYRASRARRIVRAAESAGVDYVVTTAKDAVKLRPVWPADAPPVLVANLTLSWDLGEHLVTSELEACLPETARLAPAAGRTAAGTA